VNNDIAVVGMAARLPGASTIADFWRNLAQGVESVQTFTDEQLRAEGVSRQVLQNPRYVKAGVVLDGMDRFDAEFFGFSPKEAAIMDPQHRQFLECAWEALEDAAHPPSRFPGPIGVFAGCGMGAYFAYNVLRNRQLMDEVGLFLLRHTGNDKDFLATRVSYCFDLRGPSVNVQTACSTSLVAIHLACQSLLSGECDLALAGGVTIELPHRRGYMYTEGEILSPDGHCRAFDHRARGTIFGSGAGVVVLRRLDDALADKDHVYAVVKGTAVNNDGARKVGYLAPSVDGQAAAIAEALTLAGVEPRDVDYVECHGTGTEIGDPIEVSALAQAFAGVTARQVTGIGSVKTNIGHLDTAAGVASFAKVCLALHHGALPPTIHYEAPNPLIDFARTPFYVNDRLRPWPRGERPRIAGVTSLGVGGTNAHAVVAEAPPPAAPPPATPRPGHLLVWSARNGRSLDDYARALAARLRAEPTLELADVAGTLAFGRHAFPRRRVAVGRDRDEVLRLLEGEEPQRVHTHTATESAKVVFLLPGGGAQYRHMGRGLHGGDAVFRAHVDRGLDLLRGQLDVDLREVWLGDALPQAEVERAFDRPAVQLPAIFLLEYALAQSWMQRSVQPAALLGHSLGENTAACLAGVFSFADALRLVSLRGRLFERIRGGGMVSVPLGAEQVRPLLTGNLDLATENAPGLCVVSGPDAELDAFAASLLQREIEVQRVRISIAAHSRLLEPILGEFGAFLRSLPLQAPKLPFVSNRTGTWITDAQATDPQYWVDHLRHTVRFAEGVDVLMREPRHVFLEVGPGRTLSSLVRLHPAWNQDRSAIPSLRHPEEKVDDQAYLTGAYGRLWAAGVAVPLEAVVDADRPRLSLPTYAFRHQRYWIDADPEGAAAGAANADREDDVTRWLWLPHWTRTDAPARSDVPAGTWLVFVDGIGVAQHVVTRLRERGVDTVEVHLGDAYGRLAADRYAIAPELGREGYDALLRDLAASGRQVRGVLHAWLLTADRGFRPGSSFFHRCEEQGFYSLFFLAQALGGEDLAAGLRLVVLANELMGPDGATCPEKSLVLGPCLVMPRELANVSCALVDVAPPAGRRGRISEDACEPLVAAVLQELAGDERGLFAWRGGQRWRREHRPRDLAPVAAGPHRRLRERGTYLVTGGLGGVGSLVAEWLARTCRARLIVVGRRELPPREAWDTWLLQAGADDDRSRAIQTVRLLESFGAEVLVGSADVADVAQMGALVARARQRFGPVHGVFHAAGVIQDEPIGTKEQAAVERVLAPKVHGALVLEDVLGDEPTDFMVLFSSTSAVLGPPGQVDYVAGNAFLDAFARRRSAAGRPTTSLQWGVWNRVGMTAVEGGPATAEGRPEVVREPLFHELLHQGADEKVLRGRLATASTWLLDEHRTADGHALVPGTGFVEMAAQALAAIGETGPFELRDLWFFRPLHVPDGEVRELRVRLRTSIEGYEFHVQSEVVLDDGGRGWQTHGQARLLLRAMATPTPVDLAATAAGCPDRRLPAAGRDWVPSPQEAHLRFGKRWRVVRELAYGPGRAVATVALAPEFAADVERFRLHPAALDLATGFAMELIPGYDATRLWVPLAYRCLRVHDRLPREFRSVVRSVAPIGQDGGIVGVDLCLCAPDGRVLVEIEGFQMKRLEPGQVFALTPPPARGDLGSAHDAGKGGNSAAQQLLAENIHKGILPHEGMEALARLLAGEPLPECLVSPVPLPGLVAGLDRVQVPAAAAGSRFARPELDNAYVAPRDDVEQSLVRIWEELLGIDSIGVQDDFFALGGHSLIAVRLFAKVKKQFRIDYPMSVLFEAPTVERLAALLRRDGVVAGDGAAGVGGAAAAEAPRSRYRHLVAMHPNQHGAGTPLFLVAGMFGNVLNLRHLAQLAGTDRAFYGLQARGLFGDMAPHDTFAAAAHDYLQEVRAVQPHGPYLLGGFSGGGITAYEMAQQLLAAGETVAMLALLDTPLPTRSIVGRLDRAKIQWQRARREGPAYVAGWLKRRVQWELGRLRRRFGADREQRAEPVAAFHSQAVEAAFRAALARYEVRPLPVRTWLFRPALDTTYDLGGGRFANRARELVSADNGWTPFVRDLQVVETPGDHDSMVLEPNVRSLAAALRQAIGAATTTGGRTSP
jgi:acyl transferase domain-containing protein/thioesterase domain-containing protein/NADP-dependent 3-hydroxy acid dehydrogenase YdfG/acyl carrier protein